MELMEIPGEIKILLLIPSGKKKGWQENENPELYNIIIPPDCIH